jgi:hypothetical protein
MQPTTQGKGLRVDHSRPQSPLIDALADFATADLRTFGRLLLPRLLRAFPTLFIKHDGVPVFKESPSHDHSSLELNKALALASSRGLSVITPLFSSSTTTTTTNTISTTTTTSSSSACFREHQDALCCVMSCCTLCASFMRSYPSAVGSSCRTLDAAAVQMRRQVELAVAAKSAGA